MSIADSLKLLTLEVQNIRLNIKKSLSFNLPFIQNSNNADSAD